MSRVSQLGNQTRRCSSTTWHAVAGRVRWGAGKRGIGLPGLEFRAYRCHLELGTAYGPEGFLPVPLDVCPSPFAYSLSIQ